MRLLSDVIFDDTFVQTGLRWLCLVDVANCQAFVAVRKLSSTVHKVDAILKPMAKLVIVQHSLGFF